MNTVYLFIPMWSYPMNSMYVLVIHVSMHTVETVKPIWKREKCLDPETHQLQTLCRWLREYVCCERVTGPWRREDEKRIRWWGRYGRSQPQTMELHIKNASVFAGMRDGTEGAPWLVSGGTMDGTKKGGWWVSNEWVSVVLRYKLFEGCCI